MWVLTKAAHWKKRRSIKELARAVHGRMLERAYPLNSFRGVYSSFDEALHDAPRSKPIGYDNAGSERWYREKMRKVSSDDYPALFWLNQALQSETRVLEVGGHVGEAYYAFARFIRYPPDLDWTVLEVPSTAQEGVSLAAERGRCNLHFVTQFDSAQDVDIVLAVGSLQYIDKPRFADAIASLSKPPKHVIVNKTPVYDGAEFVTMQNIGSAYCPYLIMNRESLIRSLDNLGYSLVDSWTKDRKFWIRGHHDKSFDHYSGFYFCLR